MSDNTQEEVVNDLNEAKLPLDILSSKVLSITWNEIIFIIKSVSAWLNYGNIINLNI